MQLNPVLVNYTIISTYLILVSCIAGCSEKSGLIESMMRDSGKFKEVLDNAESHKLQIIYTQIDRDSANKASFKTYKYRVNKDEYFYPASTIKLPVAALALEKINDHELPGFTPFSSMFIDSTHSGQTSVHKDTSSRTGFPSIANYIKKVFLVSDNDAFNRLYEFLGQREANARLVKKGYDDIRITHRLSLPLVLEENRHTNPMRFYCGDSLIYKQDAMYNDMEIRSDSAIFVGNEYVEDGQIIHEPMNFSYKNALSLNSLHRILLTLIFPEQFDASTRFNLSPSDYQFLYQFMSMYPSESDFPSYGTMYEDDYCKFLLFGGTSKHIDRNIRIFNKIGEAYGFLIDMAYIVDFEKEIEFVLGAVIYVNENNILNDNTYEYETVGYPFMRNLGELFYNYEITRKRDYKPDLSKYNWKLWVE